MITNYFMMTEKSNWLQVIMGELRLSGNHTVTEYEKSGESYSQKSAWIKHSKERIFQVMIFR